MATQLKKGAGKRIRKARRPRRSARRRTTEDEAASPAGPYRDFQREYRTALWL